MAYQSTSFRPFTPQTPSHRNLPPSYPSTPLASTLTTPIDRWNANTVTRDNQKGYGNAVNVTAGTGSSGYLPLGNQSRRILGEVKDPSNVSTLPTYPTSFTSPIVANDPDGVWGPPNLSSIGEMSIQDKLAQAEKKIRELSVENTKLRQRVYSYAQNQPALNNYYPSPAISAQSSIFFDPYKMPNYGGPQRLGYPHSDEGMNSSRVRHSSGDEGSNKSLSRIASTHMVTALYAGTFNCTDLHHDYIPAVVKILAEAEAKKPVEGANLKSAVNALAARLGSSREDDDTSILVDAVLEHAKALSKTSWGNYLCQQLLERGTAEDRMNLVNVIKDDMLNIAHDRFGTHVLCKAIMMKDLEKPILEKLLSIGVFESLNSGARKLWREYLEKCRQNKETQIFLDINDAMKGRWAELACVSQDGTIAVQQFFEIYGDDELMAPCSQEITADIAKVANTPFGHFLIQKLLHAECSWHRQTAEALLAAYPPVATGHHGIHFIKNLLEAGGKAMHARYIDALCSRHEGRTPGIVAVATSSVGKNHLTDMLTHCNAFEYGRIRTICRSYSTTLRTTQSGNDLLRYLTLIHAPPARYRVLTG